MSVLRRLRQEVDDHLLPGMPPMRCKVCGRYVFLYRRKLHTGMALALIDFYRWELKHTGQWMDYRKRLHRGASRDHGFLAFWGLVEACLADGMKGYYRITPKGCAFVEEDIRVPWAIYHFNGVCYGFYKKKIGIRRALGDKFDLDELLSDNR